jgi:hypothetical protein
MNPEQLIQTLESNAEVFKSLFVNIPEAMVRWRVATSSWNLVEIICHLSDEETEDFRRRTSLALSSGKGVLQPISPDRWVDERNYSDRNLFSQLGYFLSERKNSVAWLRSLENPDWDASFDHPELGVMSALKMLANWVAHDFHHIRQVNAIKYQFLRDTSLQDLSYAGNWKP